MDTSDELESFRGLLLRHRRRTALIQRDLAARVGVSVQSRLEWEGGLTFPAAARPQQLTRAFLEVGAFTPGRENSAASAPWTAEEREAPRMHSRFDELWFAGPFAMDACSASGTAAAQSARVAAAQTAAGAVERG
jgi:hypothetical protein